MVLGFFCWSGGIDASPASDLESPSQRVRDAAAQILRTNFTSAPRAKWEQVLTPIKAGITKTNLLVMLRPYKVTYEGGHGSGATHTDFYRLDDGWVLSCGFHNRENIDVDSILMGWKLIEKVRNVWVEPPKTFTGTWITYYANGQKHVEWHYKNGKSSGGDKTGYRADGSVGYTLRYDSNGTDADETGFFPSGRVSYRGQRKGGVQMGTWVWYNEDGSIKSTRDHTKP